MAKKQSNRCGEAHKRRMLTVQCILKFESNKTHRFTMKQILKRLELEATEANMRNVRNDIKILKEFGCPIVREKHRAHEYYWQAQERGEQANEDIRQ